MTTNPYFNLKADCPPDAADLLEVVDNTSSAVYIFLEIIERPKCKSDNILGLISSTRQFVYGHYEELYGEAESLIKAYKISAVSGEENEQLEPLKATILTKLRVMMSIINTLAAEFLASNYTSDKIKECFEKLEELTRM